MEEQVSAGVPGEAQLGQHQHLDALLGRLPHQGEAGLRIVAAVGHFDLGRARCDFDKSVPHVNNLLRGMISSDFNTIFYPNCSEIATVGSRERMELLGIIVLKEALGLCYA